MGNYTTGIILHDAATDCICEILQALEKDTNIALNIIDNVSALSMQLQQLQLCLFTHVIELGQQYQLSVAYEDMGK